MKKTYLAAAIIALMSQYAAAQSTNTIINSKGITTPGITIGGHTLNGVATSQTTPGTTDTPNDNQIATAGYVDARVNSLKTDIEKIKTTGGGTGVDKVGDLSTLKTTVKKDAVGAINEVFDKAKIAQDTADAAKTAAGVADGKAVVAKNAADAAKNAADVADGKADAAKTAAGIADGKAVVADGKAVAADTKAVAAKAAADAADVKAVAAKNAADAADVKAVAADTKAGAAQITANEAKAAAGVADQKAVAADTKAVAAKTAADEAKTAAGIADGKAVVADGKAVAAKTAADEAKTAAGVADRKAVVADGKAVAADQKATVAKTTADSAKTTADKAKADIGDITKFTTKDKTSVVGAVNSLKTDLDTLSTTVNNIKTTGNPVDKVGDLAKLATPRKDNAVVAINDAYYAGQNAMGVANTAKSLAEGAQTTANNANALATNAMGMATGALGLARTTANNLGNVNHLDTTSKTAVGAINEVRQDSINENNRLRTDLVRQQQRLNQEIAKNAPLVNDNDRVAFGVELKDSKGLNYGVGVRKTDGKVTINSNGGVEFLGGTASFGKNAVLIEGADTVDGVDRITSDGNTKDGMLHLGGGGVALPHKDATQIVTADGKVIDIPKGASDVKTPGVPTHTRGNQGVQIDGKLIATQKATFKEEVTFEKNAVFVDGDKKTTITPGKIEIRNNGGNGVTTIEGGGITTRAVMADHALFGGGTINQVFVGNAGVHVGGATHITHEGVLTNTLTIVNDDNKAVTVNGIATSNTAPTADKAVSDKRIATAGYVDAQTKQANAELHAADAQLQSNINNLSNRVTQEVKRLDGRIDGAIAQGAATATALSLAPENGMGVGLGANRKAAGVAVAAKVRVANDKVLGGSVAYSESNGPVVSVGLGFKF